MATDIHHLTDRFPDSADVIRELAKLNPDFASPCEEYEETVEELQHAGEEAQKRPSVEWLQQRRLQLEEELLAEIEGYRPV